MVKRKRDKEKDDKGDSVSKVSSDVYKTKYLKDEGHCIVIPVNMNSEEVSKTGKSIILASSKGFKWDDIDGHDIGISFNIIKKK